MIKKNENDIVKNWKTEYPKPLVSICCTAYNHSNYISETLDGFLIQETDFPFEVIINDDASTDGTDDIIREYEKKYPNIIKPVYQTENQFSKGINTLHSFCFPAVKGDYIALCEGDDYWTDPKKLQKQISFLENNPEYNICFHRSETFENSTGDTLDHFPNITQEKDFDIYDFIGANQVSTATVVYRKDQIKLPENFFKFKLGDWPMHLIYLNKGKGKYFPDVMARYRVHTQGVWSLNDRITNLKATIYMLENMDEYFEKKYYEDFKKSIMNLVVTLYQEYINNSDYSNARLLYDETKEKYGIKLKRIVPFWKKFRKNTKKYRQKIKSFFKKGKS